MLKLFLCGVLLAVVEGYQDSCPCARLRDYVDLSHPLSEKTPVWPGHRPFNMTILELRGIGDIVGQSEILVMSTHFGTHIDAPIHIIQKAHTLDQIPKRDLYGPGVVIDVREKAKDNSDYAVTKADILDFEEKNGRIPVGGIVLLNSGWGKKWNDIAAFLGTNTSDITKLKSPGFSEEAAEFLVHERDIVGIGVDTISYDVGSSLTLPAHVVFSAAGKWGLENVNNLDKLPPSGFEVYVFPLKFEGASGAPARVIAFV